MEFPDLGKQCSVKTCKQLDFLPVKCDVCSQIFCKGHFSYVAHNCTESYRKDNQVPVCPLCNIPIPVMKGEPPDIKVGLHIDNDCGSDTAQKRRKNSKNRCSADGCKKKELIPFICQRCHNNFCIKHRLEEDHSCSNKDDRSVSNAGAAALSRLQAGPFKQPSSQHGSPQLRQSTLTSIGFGSSLDRERRERQNQSGTSRATNIQGNLTEDEAMAQAIAASLQQTQSQTAQPRVATTQEEEDAALARALQLSEQEARRQRPVPATQSRSKDRCQVS